MVGIFLSYNFIIYDDGFRSAASFSKLEALTSIASNLEGTSFSEQSLQFGASDTKIKDNTRRDNDQLANYNNFQFPFSNWLPNLWPRHGKFQNQETQCKSSTRFVSLILFLIRNFYFLFFLCFLSVN